MSRCPLIILKFGGSVLTNEATLRNAVHEIYRWRRDGYRVVAVVSALSGVTDDLLRTCVAPGERPASNNIAATVSTGELRTAGLLGLHLDRAGVAATVLSPASILLKADGPALDATPIAMCNSVVERALERDGVVVIAGYVADDEHGRTVLLGRGGSDLTALFLAWRLGADRCRLIKDVDGLYERDPAWPGPLPRRFAAAEWKDALATDGTIVQHKAIRFAEANGVEFELGSLNACEPTRIGYGPTALCEGWDRPRRLRTALLGLGTVGAGVYQCLRQLEPLVELVSVVVKDTSVPRGVDLADIVLTQDPQEAATHDLDLLIELMGGVDDAAAAVETALRCGTHVVTANKTLIAERGRELARLALRHTCSLSYSAAVGGSMPLLERLRRKSTARIRSIRATVNATTNLVLDRVSRGVRFVEAVQQSQELGFAEADPTRDLDGRDAADKLCLVARELGIHGLTPADVRREPLTEESIRAHLGSAMDGRVLRHVAMLRCDGQQHEAEVRLLDLDPCDALAGTPAENNTAVLEAADGTIELVRGKGAGCWPTTEAVMADVLEIARATCVARSIMIAQNSLSESSTHRRELFVTPRGLKPAARAEMSSRCLLQKNQAAPRHCLATADRATGNPLIASDSLSAIEPAVEGDEPLSVSDGGVEPLATDASGKV